PVEGSPVRAWIDPEPALAQHPERAALGAPRLERDPAGGHTLVDLVEREGVVRSASAGAVPERPGPVAGELTDPAREAPEAEVEEEVQVERSQALDEVLLRIRADADHRHVAKERRESLPAERARHAGQS